MKRPRRQFLFIGTVCRDRVIPDAWLVFIRTPERYAATRWSVALTLPWRRHRFESERLMDIVEGNAKRFCMSITVRSFSYSLESERSIAERDARWQRECSGS